MSTSVTPGDIAHFITRHDPAMGVIVRAVGPPPVRRAAPVAERFGALARSISYQLLATRAADTIHARVIAVCGGHVSVETVLAAGPEQLRSAGLTRTKSRAMVELAEHANDGRIQFARHGRLNDVEVIRDVTVVRGIGPWTAHMYLLSTLARPDVWPSGDFGVRNGWSVAHGLDTTITEAQLRAEGDRFVGVRSSLAWYCWQAVHLSRAVQ